MKANSFTEAARLVLQEAREPLSVAKIWQAIEDQQLYQTSGATPLPSLATEMLRGCRGIAISTPKKNKPFFKAGPGSFGLVEWLTDEERAALDLEETILHAPRETKSEAARRKRVARRTARRADPERARVAIERRCGPVEVQVACIAALVETIRIAHECNPASWNLTLLNGRVRQRWSLPHLWDTAPRCVDWDSRWPPLGERARDLGATGDKRHRVQVHRRSNRLPHTPGPNR